MAKMAEMTIAFEIYVSFDTAEPASMARLSDTGQERSLALVTVNTAPESPREVKTIWQHLKDVD